MIEVDRTVTTVAPEDVAQLMRYHNELRSAIEALQQRLAATRETVRKAEIQAREADQLREEVRHLRGLLGIQGPAPTPDAAGPEVADGERQEPAEVDEAAQDWQELAQMLDAENAKLKGTIADLRHENDEWVAVAASFESQMREEGRQRKELEELAELSMAEAQRLRVELQLTNTALDAERILTEGLRADLAATEIAGHAHTPVKGPAPVGADISVRFDEVMRMLKDITAMTRRAADPSALLLSALRDMRSVLDEVKTGQHDIVSMIDEYRSALRTAQAFVTDAAVEADVPETPNQAAGTPVTLDAPDEIVAPSVDGGADHVEPADGQETDTAAAEADERWEDEFACIEDAWLAGRVVGDLHERRHFLAIVQRLRRTMPALKDDARLNHALGVVRAYIGDGFKYCLLDAALKRMHHPILNPTLLAVKIDEAKRRRRCYGH